MNCPGGIPNGMEPLDQSSSSSIGEGREPSQRAANFAIAAWWKSDEMLPEVRMREALKAAYAIDFPRQQEEGGQADV